MCTNSQRLQGHLCKDVMSLCYTDTIKITNQKFRFFLLQKVCVCVYICIYIYIHIPWICVYIYTHIHTYPLGIYTHTHTHTHTLTYTLSEVKKNGTFDSSGSVFSTNFNRLLYCSITLYYMYSHIFKVS